MHSYVKVEGLHLVKLSLLTTATVAKVPSSSMRTLSNHLLGSAPNTHCLPEIITAVHTAAEPLVCPQTFISTTPHQCRIVKQSSPQAGDAIPRTVDQIKLTAHAVPSTSVPRLRCPRSLPGGAVMSTQSPSTTPKCTHSVLSSSQSSAEVMCIWSMTCPMFSTDPHN